MKRRQFLEVTAAAAGASRLAAPFAGVRVPPSDTVRFGMIGVGMQGSGLLGAAIVLPGVTCAAAADLYDGRHTLAKEIAGANLPATREYRRLLDDKTIDCIVAAVPDHWHRRMVVEAVSAGKDIYIEKPMSHTAAEGVVMVDAVRKSGRILQVGSQRVTSQISIRPARGNIHRPPTCRCRRSTGTPGRTTCRSARWIRTSSRAGAAGRSTVREWRAICSSI